MYKTSNGLIILTLLLVTGCINAQPSLKKYGWSAVDNDEIPKHIITDVLCHTPKDKLYNSLWYINKKKD